jgi:hypothetical protein
VRSTGGSPSNRPEGGLRHGDKQLQQYPLGGFNR